MLTGAVIMGHEGDFLFKNTWTNELARKLLPTACHAMILDAKYNMLQRQQIHKFWVKSAHLYANTCKHPACLI